MCKKGPMFQRHHRAATAANGTPRTIVELTKLKNQKEKAVNIVKIEVLAK